MRSARLSYVAFAVLMLAAMLLAACGTPAATQAPTSPPVVTQAPTEAVATEAPTEAPTEAVMTEAPTEVMTATEPAATEAVTSTTDIGSASHPIKVLFVPSVEANIITSGGEVMAKALNQATGLNFEVSVPTSYAATIEEMCASPTDTMGFIPGLGYVLANQLCGVDVAFKAVRFGSDVYYAQFIVQRDSPYQTIEDLAGKKWGYGDEGSTSGYMVPLVMMQDAGVEPGEKIATGGHSQTVNAVYNGSVDFGTTFYTPPLKPEGETQWKEGDPPDIPDDMIDSCAPSADGAALMCGDWRVLDARSNIRTEAPDVVQKVRVMLVSPPIPNDTLSFGPEFPADLRSKIESALVEFSKTEEWQTSIGSQDFYGWTGLNPATDAEYDFVRKMVEATGLTLEGLGQ